MEETPEISIISINYNGLNHTCDMIRSLRKNLTISYELIIIDNASLVNEAAIIQKEFPETICIRSKKNLGFSGGNNQGIKLSRGKYILLLNNDTYITDNSVSFLTDRIKSDPLIGGVSPKIRFATPPQKIQYAGYTPLSPITLRNSPIGFMEEERGQYNTPKLTPYLHGAAMMIKREVIEKVGFMPEIYFLYYEELDWSVQMRKHGYLLYYEPACTVFHKESQSTGQESPLRTFFITRNRLLYAYRNRNGVQKYLSIGYQLSVSLAKNSMVFLTKGRPDLMKAAFSGAYRFFFLKNKLNQL